MFSVLDVCQQLLWLYRERFGSPEFWAEPLNALSNAAFLIAASFACDLASSRRAMTPTTVVLLSLASLIGFGSFCFHTIPNRLTMWLDILPIALFQLLLLWVIAHRVFSVSKQVTAVFVVAVLGSSLLLLPIHQILNGSLFYLPSFLALLVFGITWMARRKSEPYLLVAAASCFALAIVARSVDWIVPWQFGTHFLWHILNGIVVYLTLRAWIVESNSAKLLVAGPRGTSAFGPANRILE